MTETPVVELEVVPVEPTTIYEVLNKIQKELKAPKGQKNAFGGYKYRSCEDIVEAVKPLLGKATLTLSDEVVMLGNRFYVKAHATIQLGDNPMMIGTNSITVFAYAREAESKKGMDEAQITGAASSYARKYALNGLFAIDDTKDADATNDGAEEEKGDGKVFVPKTDKKGVITNKPTEDQIPFEDKTLPVIDTDEI